MKEIKSLPDYEKVKQIKKGNYKLTTLFYLNLENYCNDLNHGITFIIMGSMLLPCVPPSMEINSRFVAPAAIK